MLFCFLLQEDAKNEAINEYCTTHKLDTLGISPEYHQHYIKKCKCTVDNIVSWKTPYKVSMTYGSVNFYTHKNRLNCTLTIIIQPVCLCN